MTDTGDRVAEAYELGTSRGWDHAGFVDAYGPGHERRTPDYPAWMLTDPAALGHEPGHSTLAVPERLAAEREQRQAWQAEFKRGWSDGRRRFHRGQYADGTKIED